MVSFAWDHDRQGRGHPSQLHVCIDYGLCYNVKTVGAKDVGLFALEMKSEARQSVAASLVNAPVRR